MIGGLLLIVLGAYYLVSQQLWKDYQTAHETSHSHLQAQIDAVFKLPTDTSDEKQAKITALKNLAQQSKTNCQVGLLIGWQSGIIPPLKDQKTSCEDRATKDQALKESLNKVAAYLENEQTLMKTMTSANLPAEVDESTIESQVSQWQGILAQVKGISVQPDFEPVKQIAITSVATIVAAWQALHEANHVADQTAYEAARTKLTESYDQLAAIAPAGQKQLTTLIDLVRSAYTASF